MNWGHIKTAIKIIFQLTGIAVSWWILSIFMPQISFPIQISGMAFLNYATLLAPYAFMMVLFLSRPIDFVGPVIKFLDSKHLFWEFSIYGLFSAIICTALVGYLLSGAINLLSIGADPLLVYYFDGHWMSWFVLSLVVARFGWKNILRGIIACAFVYGSHEATWFISSAAQFSSPVYTGEAYSAGFFSILRGIITSYLPLFATVVAILVTYYFAYRIFTWRRELLIFMIPAVWGAIQLVVGFPNTLVLGQATPYFTTWWVNLAEVLSWSLPALVALWPSKTDIQASSKTDSEVVVAPNVI